MCTLNPWVGSSIYTAEHQRLAALLREMREGAGLTQTDLALRLGRNQSYVTRYETNRRRIDFAELLAVLKALKVSLTEFAEQYEERASRRR